MNDDFELESGPTLCAYGGNKDGLAPGIGGAEWAYGGERDERGGFDEAAAAGEEVVEVEVIGVEEKEDRDRISCRWEMDAMVGRVR